jgi:transaldolase / glucose-6-phosphate isomerase
MGIANQLQMLRVRSNQSPWLDGLLPTGQVELFTLISNSAVGGVTTSAFDFSDAITNGDRFKDVLATFATQKGIHDLFTVTDAIVFAEAAATAKRLEPLHRALHHNDGYVSVDLHSVMTCCATDIVGEARRVYDGIGHKNVMINIPASAHGLEAIPRVIALGIPVNVTHIFGLETYRDVAEAYLSGLEERVAAGQSLIDVASVASISISPIDRHVDELLDARIKSGNFKGEGLRLLTALKGKVAVSIAKLIYRNYKSLFSGSRWDALFQKGALVQRPLWTDTTPTDPSLSPTHYYDSLVGPGTVAAMSLDGLTNFRKHGNICPKLGENVVHAEVIVESLGQHAHISMEDVSANLLAEGLRAVDQAFDQIINNLAKTLSGLMVSKSGL